MRYSITELNKYRNSAIFTMTITLLVLYLILQDCDSLVICIFGPVCMMLFIYATYTLVGILKAKKEDSNYLMCDREYIVNYNLFGKETFRILKSDINKIYISGDIIHICVNTKRKLRLRERIVSLLIEDRYYTYTFVLYSGVNERMSLSEYFEIDIETENHEMMVGKLLLLSRFLFIFIFSLLTCILTVIMVNDAKLYIFSFAVAALALVFDALFNKHALYKPKGLLGISLKCIIIGFAISQYLTLGTLNTKIISIEGTGNKNKLMVIYIVTISVCYCLCMFNRNIVSLINRKNGWK